ncbi:MAG: PIG-L family deacetylase [Chloroflexia bacterium]
MERTLMALFAHPDDESFATGGTLARYAAAGVQVVLVCATRGEAGIVHDEGMEVPPEEMGRVREEELRCACRALGIQELHFLGYRDSGMAGSPENRHPLAFCRAEPAEVVERILALFRRFRPQVVLTFGPDGGYGHPDHIAIHRHVTAAWKEAGSLPQPPRKLYYTAVSAATFRRIREAMWQHGLIPEPPSEEEVARRGIPEERITTAVDVRDFLGKKVAALRCHRTQLPPNHPWLNLPEDFRRTYMGYETFVLADARGVEAAPKEEDLFAGL